MKAKDKEQLCFTVDNEGFDYAFRHYSSFDKIKDKRFHQLREAYVKAAGELEEYIACEDC